jgi:hypothetical protein
VWVTGTISTGPDGSESLEVVFTLKPVCELPEPCGVIELIRCESGVIDEEETSTSGVEEAIQETDSGPATAKVLFTYCSRDQSSECQVL